MGQASETRQLADTCAAGRVYAGSRHSRPVAVGLRRPCVAALATIAAAAAAFATVAAAAAHATVAATVVVVSVEVSPVHSAAHGRRVLPDSRDLPLLPQAVCHTIHLPMDLLSNCVEAAGWRQLDHRKVRPRHRASQSHRRWDEGRWQCHGARFLRRGCDDLRPCSRRWPFHISPAHPALER
eukprot:scaffold23081_cov61-Phaeocystis_antarctica.AAC.2